MKGRPDIHLLKKIKGKGFDWFKQEALRRIKGYAEDSDIFWDIVEDER